MNSIPVWAYIVTCVIGTILIGVAYMRGGASMLEENAEDMEVVRDLLKDAKIRRRDMQNRYAQLLAQKGSAIREAQFWKRTAKNLGWHKGLARPVNDARGADPVPTETVSR
jgi:hypothetical protein